MEIESDGVECPAHIEPVGRSYDSLVAKAEHLSSTDNIDPPVVRVAKLHISLPNIPNVLVGGRGYYVAIEEDPRILCDSDEFEPVRGLKVNADAKLSQIVPVIDGRIADSILALHSIAKLAAE